MFSFPISVPLLPSPLQTLIVLTWPHWCLVPPGWRYIYAYNLNFLLQLKTKILFHKPLLPGPSGFPMSPVFKTFCITRVLFSLDVWSPCISMTQEMYLLQSQSLSVFWQGSNKSFCYSFNILKEVLLGMEVGETPKLNEYFNGLKITPANR